MAGSTVQKIVIDGGARSVGEVRISGSKNAALPILAASLLPTGTSTFRNVPAARATSRTMGELLAHLGARCEVERPATLDVDADATITELEAPYELVKTMRASVLVLGPLVRATAARGCRCRAAARSARGRSTST